MQQNGVYDLLKMLEISLEEGFPIIPRKYTNAFDFCADLLEKSGIVTVPGNAFGSHGEGYFRVSFVCSDEQLQEVIDRMKADGFTY